MDSAGIQDHANSQATAAQQTVSLTLTCPTNAEWLRRQAKVALTLPALSFTGDSDLPGELDDGSPIPVELARELAARVPTLLRLLTDPVDGHILDSVARTYIASARMRATIEAKWGTCVVPGCYQKAQRCELDHRVPFNPRTPAEGGHTTIENLQPLCKKHHQMKTEDKLFCWKASHEQPATPATNSSPADAHRLAATASAFPAGTSAPSAGSHEPAVASAARPFTSVGGAPTAADFVPTSSGSTVTSVGDHRAVGRTNRSPRSGCTEMVAWRLCGGMVAMTTVPGNPINVAHADQAVALAEKWAGTLQDTGGQSGTSRRPDTSQQSDAGLTIRANDSERHASHVSDDHICDASSCGAHASESACGTHAAESACGTHTTAADVSPAKTDGDTASDPWTSGASDPSDPAPF